MLECKGGPKSFEPNHEESVTRQNDSSTSTSTVLIDVCQWALPHLPPPKEGQQNSAKIECRFGQAKAIRAMGATFALF